MILNFYENSADGKGPFEAHLSTDLSFPVHTHPQLELIWVLEGNLEITIDGNSKVLNPNDCVLIFPNIIHGYETIEHSKIMFFIFDLRLVSDYRQLFLYKKLSNPFFRLQELNPAVLQIFQYILEHDTLYPLQTSMKDGLLKPLLNLLVYFFLQKSTLISIDRQERPDVLVQALTFIEDHYTEPISLQSVANELGISYNYLSKTFSKRILCHFNDYIKGLRIAHAKELLIHSDKTITDICFDSGFSSINTFLRVFKNDTGMSPTSYIKLHTKK